MWSRSSRGRESIRKAAENLQTSGYKLDLEPSVAPGYRPDFVVHGEGGKTLLVECKAYEPRAATLTYDVIGQVALYAQKYKELHPSGKTIPVLIGDFKITPIVQEIASSSGVLVVPINTSSPGDIAREIIKVLKS